MLPSRLIAAALSAFSVSACAGTKNVERSYVRPDLQDIPLRSVDAFVFIAGPPRHAGATLDVNSFDPPADADPLALGPADEPTTRAVADALRRELVGRGYELDITSPVSLEVARTFTSTAIVETSTAAVTTAWTQAKAPSLAGGNTLAELRKASDADAILIVRAVPIDGFTIDVGGGTRTEVTDLGRELIRDSRPIEHEGRLLLGQMFLFDRKTGLRLWTKQVPDFPDAGLLTKNHPFLSYGFVHGPSTGAVPPSDARAEPAAKAFTEKMLADFPRAHAGTAAARARLDQSNIAEEHELQSFFDEGRFVLDLGARFSHGPFEMSVEVDGAGAPELGTGALAPYGFASIAPRASYMAAGGWMFSLALPIGLAPGSFARSYHLDDRDLSDGDRIDRNAEVSVRGAFSFGAELLAGPTVALTPEWLLIPQGGAFYELVSFDAAPESILRDTTRSRAGGVLGADLWILASKNSAFFGRAGGAVRVGKDLAAGLAVSIALSAGVGVFL